jgi:hypothetical protein
MSLPELNVPMPLATILPGILLAGEIIKERCFREYTLNSLFEHDTFCLPISECHRLVPPVARCPFCGDREILDKFRAKYA